MTVTKWYYRELSDDEPRNEFMGYSQFTSTSVVEAFVREVIQNSIDAKRPDQEVVRVDFRFATADDTAREAFFGGDLGVHLGMRDALQDGDRNRFDELRDSGTKSWASPLRYLTVEDWGTLGIEGDHETGPRRTNNMNKNRFRYFHWSFGQTDTTVEDKGGSWGYGRAALTLASKTLTIMALSTRNQHPGNDSTVHQSLMGNSIIRTHSYAGKEYSWFGHYCDTDGNSRMPLISTSESQREEVEDFKNKFGISRTISHEDKGLSIVVPFPKDDFTPHSVARAVLKSYFAAITVNQLVVTVSDQDEGIQWKFDNDGMKHHLKNEELEWSPNAGDKIDPMEITDFIQLMERGFVQDPIELVPESKDSHPSIQEMLGSMNSEDRKKYHSNLTKPNDSQTLRFEIKMPLEDNKGKWHWGCFKVFIAQREQGKATAIHRHIIRVIDDEPLARVPEGIIALIIIPQTCNNDDNALHTMLRRSEGPAHLTWRHNEGTVADHWKRPNVIHPFIRRSALEIFNGLRQLDGSEEIRPGWVQSLTKNKKGAAKVSSGAGGDGGGIVVPGSKSVPMDANRFEGGITFMLPVDTKTVEGDVVKFEVAYTVRRGSPWSNHSEADFDISAGDLTVEVKGGKIVDTGVNNVEVLISNKEEFTLEIAGFDESLERISRTTIPNTEGDEQ